MFAAFCVAVFRRVDGANYIYLIPLTVPFGPAVTLGKSGHSTQISFVELAIYSLFVLHLLFGEFRATRWYIAAVVLFALAIPGIGYSPNPTLAILGLRTILTTGLAAVLAGSVDPTHAQRNLSRLTAAMVAMGVIITGQLVFTGRTLQGTSSIVDANGIQAYLQTGLKTDVFWGRSNYVATFLVLAIASVLTFPYQSRLNATTSSLAVGIMSYGILVTTSRTQLIALGTVLGGSAYAAVSQLSRRPARAPDRRRARTVIVALTTIACAIVALGLGRSLIHAIAFRSDLRGLDLLSTGGGRMPLWKAGINSFRRHPLTGNGPGQIRQANGQFALAHNGPIQLLSETGVPGLIAYFAIAGMAFRSARRLPESRPLLLALVLVISGFAEPTIRTGAYDYVLWSLLSAAHAAGKTVGPSQVSDIGFEIRQRIVVGSSSRSAAGRVVGRRPNNEVLNDVNATPPATFVGKRRLGLPDSTAGG